MVGEFYTFGIGNSVSITCEDRLSFLNNYDSSSRLVITSPPYNIGKEYEKNGLDFDEYLKQQRLTLEECTRILADDGSLCWQVGNYVSRGEIFPLDIYIWNICKDIGLRLRNRIVWRFEHGLHCSKRFSGRYETILWFTKTDDYIFNLDPVRVPQKYPGKKHFKGERKGELSCNPLGKNPGDVWDIPNVKHNHCEKTDHPCQFPIELAERLVLALSNENDLVVDPYMGSGSTLCAAIKRNRSAAGCDIKPEYFEIADQRVQQAIDGTLKTRPMGREVLKIK